MADHNLINTEDRQIKFPLSEVDWRHAYRLACNNYWEPAGTKPDQGWIRAKVKGGTLRELSAHELDEMVDDEMAKWNTTDYFNKYCQIVKKEDAEKWAGALKRVLESSDIPPDSPSEKDKENLPNIKLHPKYNTWIVEGGMDSAEYFGGNKGKQKLSDFIDFLRKGSFSIE